jgi:hypothetical protein
MGRIRERQTQKLDVRKMQRMAKYKKSGRQEEFVFEIY